MLTRAKTYLRRHLRAAQRTRHYPLLLPSHQLSGTTLRSTDNSEHPLPPPLAAALKLSDGSRPLAAIAREAKIPRPDLIRAHDDGLLLFWPRPIPPAPPPEPHALHGIILSPHLDDAALSCGGRMLGDAALLVLNVFTQAAWWRFPFTTEDASRIQACRATEEDLVSRLSNCATRPLHLPEALLRGRTMADLFTASPDHRDTAVSHTITDAVTSLAQAHPLAHWYLPLGIGNHLDHRLARDAALAALRDHPKTHLHFYEDLPYAAQEPPTDRAHFLPNLPLRREVLNIDDQLPWKLELLRAYWSQFRWSDLAPLKPYARRAGSGDPAEITWTPERGNA